MPLRADESRLLNPGVLRHQITWQRKVLGAANSYGEPTYTWQTVLTCRAQVKYTGGSETKVGEQRASELKYEIKQHCYEGLDTAMRIQWFDEGIVKLLDVTAIGDPVSGGRVQMVSARRVVNG